MPNGKQTLSFSGKEKFSLPLEFLTADNEKELYSLGPPSIVLDVRPDKHHARGSDPGPAREMVR